MRHVTKYLNIPIIEEALVKLEEERTQIRRRQNALRQQVFKLKKLIQDHKQLVLELEDE